MKSTDKIIDYLKKTYQPESIIVYGGIDNCLWFFC